MIIKFIQFFFFFFLSKLNKKMATGSPFNPFTIEPHEFLVVQNDTIAGAYVPPPVCLTSLNGLDLSEIKRDEGTNILGEIMRRRGDLNMSAALKEMLYKGHPLPEGIELKGVAVCNTDNKVAVVQYVPGKTEYNSTY